MSYFVDEPKKNEKKKNKFAEWITKRMNLETLILEFILRIFFSFFLVSSAKYNINNHTELRFLFSD